MEMSAARSRARASGLISLPIGDGLFCSKSSRSRNYTFINK